jgi:oligoribonuclease
MFEQITDRTPAHIGLDLETTGLNAKLDRILEVSFQLLDEDFEIIPTSGAHTFVVRMTSTHRAKLVDSPVALNMHQGNGLFLDALHAPKSHTIKKIDERIDVSLRNMYVHFGGFEKVGRLPLFGSSVHFDQAFVNNHMPMLAKLIHYRVSDVTSMKALMVRKGWVEQEGRQIAHRAADDLQWSIDIAQELRDFEASR